MEKFIIATLTISLLYGPGSVVAINKPFSYSQFQTNSGPANRLNVTTPEWGVITEVRTLAARKLARRNSVVSASIQIELLTLFIAHSLQYAI